jgi:hypothetical protein
MQRLPLWVRKVYVSADKIAFIGEEDDLKLIYLQCGQVVRCPLDLFPDASIGDFYVRTGDGDVSICPPEQFQSEHTQVEQ